MQQETNTSAYMKERTSTYIHVDHINEGWLVSDIFANITLTNFLKDDVEPEEAVTRQLDNYHSL